ncbi:unnamed protein product [Boreogadus saida]
MEEEQEEEQEEVWEEEEEGQRENEEEEVNMAKTCQAALLAEEELQPRGPLAPHAQWLRSLAEQGAVV